MERRRAVEAHLGECDCAAPIDAMRRHYAGGRMNRDKRSNGGERGAGQRGPEGAGRW